MIGLSIEILALTTSKLCEDMEIKGPWPLRSFDRLLLWLSFPFVVYA